MNAVIYARYSSHAQNDASIEQQIDECKAYAQAHNYDVVGVYADRAMSGRSDRRPEFQRMLRASERHEFQVVLAYKSNRIARNMLHALSYENKLAANGVNVIYCKEEFGDNAAGRFALRTMMNVNQFYSENMAEDIERGMMDNARQCRVNGALPLGYVRGKDGRYCVDESSAAVVREIFERVANGEIRAHIADDLNRRGIRTNRGARWNKGSFNCILSNERYLGYYIYKDVRIANGVPPIVSAELFERAQNKVERSKDVVRGRRRREDMEYILTGKLFCGYCGKPLVGGSGTGKSGKIYYYYRCTNGDCTQKAVRKDVVEPLVVDALRECVTAPENLAWLVDMVTTYMKELRKDSDVGYLEDKLKDTKTAKGNVMKAIELGIITQTTKARLEELESEEKEILSAILAEKQRMPELSREHVQFFFESFAKGNVNSDKYKKSLIRQFLRSVYLFSDHIKITFDFDETDTGYELPLESANLESVRISELWYTPTNLIKTRMRISFVRGVFVAVVPFR